MGLIESYQLIKPSIVAFCAKYSNDTNYCEPGKFPHIIGTGFIIDSRGIILTNQHVVDGFQKVPRPKDSDPLEAVEALLFDQKMNEMRTPHLEIYATTKITSHKPIDCLFDRRPPDIALVAVKYSDLPACKFRTESGGITEGLGIGTAGYPMGTVGLVDPADGLIQQLSPVLQRGIISAIQPFAVENPVSFTINILLQYGASGSPVFNLETGEVIGVACQRRFELSLSKIIDQDQREVRLANGKKMFATVGLPTNFSLVIPTYIIAKKWPSLIDELVNHRGVNHKSFKEYYTGKEQVELKPNQAINQIQSTRSNQVTIRKFDDNSSN